MGIVAPKVNKREPVSAGLHIARCYYMIVLGTIEKEFKGTKKKSLCIRIGWELPEIMRVFKEGDEPMPATVSKEYTLSMAQRANLRKDLESWRSKPFSPKEAEEFDLTKLLGANCMINIAHKEGKGDNAGVFYENIIGISSVPKNLPVPQPINEAFYFNYDEKFSADFVAKLPEFIRKSIQSSDEWKSLEAEGKTGTTQTSHVLDTASISEHEGNASATEVDDMPF